MENGTKDPDLGMHEPRECREYERCYIIHAMPNTASRLSESATILSTSTAPTDKINPLKAKVTRPLPPMLEMLAT